MPDTGLYMVSGISIRFLLLLLSTAALSGCVTGPSPQMKNAPQYVRTHKGEGTTGIVPTDFAAAYQAFANNFEKSACHEDTYHLTKLPLAHVLYADCRPTPKRTLSWAVWFYSGDSPEQTKVEVLVASEWLQANDRRKFESDIIREVLATIRPEAGAPASGPDSGPDLRKSLEDIQKLLLEE